jgi:uncharacterized protein (DUF362 family)
MDFKPEDLVIHRERYQAYLAEIRPKDYPPLLKKDVVGRVELRHRRPNPYVRDGKALVSFVLATDNLKDDIRKAIDKLGGLELAFKPQDRILIKPNFNSDDPPPGSTALDFISSVVDILREHGYSNITVGEGSGRPWVPTEKVLRKMGLLDKMAQMNVPVMDFDKSQYVDVPVDGEFLDVAAYPRDLEDFDKIIYLPTMKTHYLAGFSMSIKLAVGFVHLFDRAILHSDNNMFVSQRSAEMAIPIKPDLILMDGRVSFVSGGPAMGLKVHPGVILASGDMVAMDVQGVRLLQNYAAINHLHGDPWKLPQIAQAVKHNLGIREETQLLFVR